MPRMRRNHSEATPQRVIFLDCEAESQNSEEHENVQVQRLRLAVAQYVSLSSPGNNASDEIVTTDPARLWQWVAGHCHAKSVTWLVAHNAGYDLGVARWWEQLTDGDWSLTVHRRRRSAPADEYQTEASPLGTICIVESPPTVIRAECPRGRLLIVDSLNYVRAPLADLGQSVGLEKLAMPRPGESADAWERYCRRDVDILREWFCRLVRWWRSQRMGMFRWTAPSCAMACFRHRNPVEQIDNDRPQDVIELEREAYYAGEVRVNRIGEIDGPLTMLDVDSLFPHVMAREQYPTNLSHASDERVTNEAPPDHLIPRCIARVQLDSPLWDWPVRIAGRTVQARGRFTTALCGPELVRAWRLGLIERWGRWVAYDMDAIFAEHIRRLHSHKLEAERDGNAASRMFCKLLMNSLYGKFGQMTPGWEHRPDIPPLADYGKGVWLDRGAGKSRQLRYIAGQTFCETDRVDHPSSFAAIAAFVTAYAREEMHRHRQIAGPHNVYYQGVDSLLVNAAGRAMLERHGRVAGGEIGRFRVKREVARAEIRGPQWYRVGDVITIAGRPSTAEDLERWGWTAPSFETLVQQLDRGPDGTVVVTRRSVRPSEYTPPGRIGIDGWVEPYLLPEDDEWLRKKLRRISRQS